MRRRSSPVEKNAARRGEEDKSGRARFHSQEPRPGKAVAVGRQKLSRSAPT